MQLFHFSSYTNILLTETFNGGMVVKHDGLRKSALTNFQSDLESDRDSLSQKTFAFIKFDLLHGLPCCSQSFFGVYTLETR